MKTKYVVKEDWHRDFDLGYYERDNIWYIATLKADGEFIKQRDSDHILENLFLILEVFYSQQGMKFVTNKKIAQCIFSIILC